MVFHKSCIQTNDVKAVMQQNSIDCVNSVKILGLIIDDILNCHEYSQHVNKK